jgi:hypothetical protein
MDGVRMPIASFSDLAAAARGMFLVDMPILHQPPFLRGSTGA